MLEPHFSPPPPKSYLALALVGSLLVHLALPAGWMLAHALRTKTLPLAASAPQKTIAVSFVQPPAPAVAPAPPPAPAPRPTAARAAPPPPATPVAQVSPASTSPPAPPPVSISQASEAIPASASAPSPAPVSYLAQLKAWIGQHRRYPRRARREGLEGTALLRFSLDRAGRLVTAKLEKSSGHAQLDREALDLLKRAQPMPRPPLADAPALDITLPITFRLL